MPGWLETLDPRFFCCVLPNAPLLTLGTGLAWAEGPVWCADANQLLFSDVPNNRIMRWTEETGVSVFRLPSDFTNGQTRDLQGRLIGCSHQGRSITRTELDGSITILASRYQGKKLNGPNDVVVSGDGTIWFSDPLYGGNTDYEGGKHEMELPPTLYSLSPDGNLTIAADDFDGPNGLCFSPDETQLYVAESGTQFAEHPRHCIRLFDVDCEPGSSSATSKTPLPRLREREGPSPKRRQGEGSPPATHHLHRSQPAQTTPLRNGRTFHTITPGYADGLRCDTEGRIWSSAADGVHCIHPDGTLLGKILTGCTVSNIAFGGRNKSRLFICASHTLMAIYTNVRGAARP